MTMYEIRRRRDGQKVATVFEDPYEYQTLGAAGPGIRDVLREGERIQQMNRTAGDEKPTEDDESASGAVSEEGYQDPSPSFRLDTIADQIRPGYVMVQVDETPAAASLSIEAAEHFSEGDEVDTPDGQGVVVEIRTEPFEGPGGDEVDASDDSPAYVVGVESGAAVFRGDDLTLLEDGIDVEGVDDPTGDLGDADAEAMLADVTPGSLAEARQALAQGDDGRRFDYPESWDESPTPNRIILLKAWAGLGGRFTTCRRKMTGEVRSPARFCASMKDRVLMWEGWRQ